MPNRPYVVDIYSGDNVQDTPGPLGGFQRTKDSGIAFLIHKCTEGVGYQDSRYAARRAAWMTDGLIPVTDTDGTVLQLKPRWAAYHFFHGANPVAEADYFLAHAALKPGDDACCDWEQVGASGYAPSADAVHDFCSRVEKMCPWLTQGCMIYSGNVAKEQLHGFDPRFSKRRLWLASYGSTFTVQASWRNSGPWLWQDDGDQWGPGPHHIPGMDGYCDNSTVVTPMTVKRLYTEWGGGVPNG